MKPRIPLVTKVVCIALLNLGALAVVLLLFARVQFRMDPGSFLLAPAQNRILAAAHTLALELEELPQDSWERALGHFAEANSVDAYLLDEEGRQVAGPEFRPPAEVGERVPVRRRPEGGRRGGGERPLENLASPEERRPPLKPREARGPAPPLFLTSAGSPARYWAGVRIPLRMDRLEHPKPGTLIVSASSLLASPLLFDPKPWVGAMLAVVFVSLLCWLPFVRGVTHSLALLTGAAGRIAEGRFDVQVAGTRRDEIGQLGEAVNRMASRLAGFVDGQKRFMGGIAHELCTPIATIQFGLGSLERGLDDAQKMRLADIQEEVEHMSALVNELLSFSRAGMPGVDLRLVPVNLAATVARVIQREVPPGQSVEICVDSGLHALANQEALFRAVSNLVRNAVRYAGEAGPIGITARAAQNRVFLTVSDQGPGVPEAAIDEIFKPFYRLDASRNQTTGGIGLGLAIVKSSIESCGGVVRCRNRQPSGLEMEIELAMADPD